MNKMVAVIGLCVLCAVSSFAQRNLWKGVLQTGRIQTKLLAGVQRNVAASGFVQKQSLSSVVNGYLRMPTVTHFSLSTGEPMRAVRFSRNIALEKENLLVPKGSLAVVNQAGDITLYAPEEVLPADIQAGLDAASPELLDFVLEPAAEQTAKAWSGKLSYDNQVDLAKDLDAYYEGNAEKKVFNRVVRQEGKIYRVPFSNIYYHPAGNTSRYLDPNEDLIIFYPATGEGQILFGGISNKTWRKFFAPLQ